MDMDEDIETYEEPDIVVMKSINRSLVDRVKEKKRQKDVTTKSSMKNTEVVKEKTPQEKSVSKKREVKEKTAEKKSLVRKLVQTSDSETNAKEDAQYIVSTIRRKVGRKRIHVNVPAAPMDNVSTHSKTSVLKWKYVFQRRIAAQRDLGKDALDCKEIMNLLKVS